MLLALAALFAVINGANDGGAMVATTPARSGQRAVVSIAALSAALVVVPAVVGTGVARVALIGLAAPVAGAAVAQVLAKASSAMLAAAGGQGLATFGWVATGARAIAYAASDGQKMLAVLGVAAGGVALPPLVGIAVLFAGGSVVGTA